ncbi:MAG: hypothetical protein A2142_00375 [candidate division Zixibacteria bacterium RBG_16_48_11]|nr:MAG: hypothetical protein A2142_00375 [candidate division Zixibacteria bacterium RBG_16_48_11]
MLWGHVVHLLVHILLYGRKRGIGENLNLFPRAKGKSNQGFVNMQNLNSGGRNLLEQEYLVG